MRCPEIISFHNGVIEWSAEQGSALFDVSVNGKKISDGADGFYRSASYKINTEKNASIRIAVAGESAAAISLVYDGNTKKLALAPITEYVVDGDRLEWRAVCGAKKYRVYDIDFNVTTVDCTHYDFFAHNLVWCVCPVPENGALCESAPINAHIPYLRGDGTKDSPYLINTPTELRAVDYYETEYALCGGERKHYRLARDIDYRTVGALESESNIYSLKKPFFGDLDGNGKRLSHIHVRYHGGYWALFDFVAGGGRIGNIVFDGSEIYNFARDNVHPINSTTATVAYMNNGEIYGITLDGVTVAAAGGGVCGIAAHNSGTVKDCRVRGTFVQDVTSDMGSASYEMSGIVLENRAGGVVSGNAVLSAILRGTGENIRAAAGVVSVNRAGGVAENNSFDAVTVNGKASGAECGGIVAYNSGSIERGGARLGTLVVDGGYTDHDVGGEFLCGKLVGKNDGSIF